MPQQHEFYEAAEEWLDSANGDLLGAARSAGLELYLEVVCFNSQQCVEKSLKAILVAHGKEFPFTHRISTLTDCLEDAGIVVPAYLADTYRLSLFAVATRYPGSVAKPNNDEYVKALRIAQQTHDWAKSVVAKLRSNVEAQGGPE